MLVKSVREDGSTVARAPGLLSRDREGESVRDSESLGAPIVWVSS